MNGVDTSIYATVTVMQRLYLSLYNNLCLPMKIYFSVSISLLTAFLCFLVWTFPFFYSLWFHIFPFHYLCLFNTLFTLTSTNLLLILGHLIWFALHSYFYLIAFLSLIFHCLYFLLIFFINFFSISLSF